MAWTDSRIFVAMCTEVLKRTTAFDLDTDASLVALYNNTPTPDYTATLANSAYNVGAWATANEQSATGWAAGGVALVTPTVTNPTTATVMFDAVDTASAAGTTLANVYGCLVYDNTIAQKYGICYNYFGGVNSVTNGVLTVVWNANGLFRLTL
jgi:hypothetical protein